MVAGHGFRRRPIVAADFHPRSVNSTRVLLIPLRLCPSASMANGSVGDEVPRCTKASSFRGTALAHPGAAHTIRELRRRSARTHPKWDDEKKKQKGPAPFGCRASVENRAWRVRLGVALSRSELVRILAFKHRSLCSAIERARAQLGRGADVRKMAFHDGFLLCLRNDCSCKRRSE